MDSTIIFIEKDRTSGDGMEETEQDESLKQIVDDTSSIAKANAEAITKQTSNQTVRKNSVKNITVHNNNLTNVSPMPGLHSLFRKADACITRNIAPNIPKGELVLLKPRLITPISTVPEHKKNKVPKFVPYEPYPGAVNPLEYSNGRTSPKCHKLNKNNLDINVLVRQMSTMRTQELKDETQDDNTPDKPIEINANCNQTEVDNLKEELKKMKEERDYYQSQFKFQTQVNSELKNLLVASVGEDLQTHVNVLTEDKLQLARALLDTANNLTTHTEQIEFLAGQCEVWRSKFLSSSVMVEELARWKADLTQKNVMLNESTKLLLHAMHQLREMQLEMLKNLKFLAKIRYLNLPSTDVITLCSENLNILQQMVLHSGVGMPDENLNISSASTNPLCDAETYAVQALKFISQPLMATDDAIKALFNQAQRPIRSSNCNLGNSGNSLAANSLQ